MEKKLGFCGGIKFVVVTFSVLTMRICILYLLSSLSFFQPFGFLEATVSAG